MSAIKSLIDPFRGVSTSSFLFLVIGPLGLGITGLVYGEKDSDGLLLGVSSMLVLEAVIVGMMLITTVFERERAYIARGRMEDRADKYHRELCARITDLERQLKEK